MRPANSWRTGWQRCSRSDVPVRTKAIPAPPADCQTLERIRGAVPLVPGSVEDCCSHIVAEAGDVVPGRDDANRWLAFLEALDLVAEYDRGYARTRTSLDRESVAERFTDRVYGAAEVQAILAEGNAPLDAATVVERFESHVPPWERRRDPGGWRERWRGRVKHLLEWLVVLGLVERTEEGYRPVDSGP